MKLNWNSLTVAGAVALALGFGPPLQAAEEKKPNILVIMSDDVGITNLSAYSRGMGGITHPTSIASPPKVFYLPITMRSKAAPREGQLLLPDSRPSGPA